MIDDKALDGESAPDDVVHSDGQASASDDLLAQIANVQRARAHWDSVGQPVRVAVCHRRIAELWARLGDFDSADEHFEAARRGLALEGMHHYQANIQWRRVRRYLDEAASVEQSASENERRVELVRQAVDAAVSSYIATEYERFQSVADDDEWEVLADQRLASTFDIAYSLGTVELVAELIDCGINSGIHRAAPPESEGLPAEPARSGLVEPVARPALVKPIESPASQEQHADGFDPIAMSLGAAARLLDSSRLKAEPPPALLYPAGGGTKRLGLRTQRELAAGLDPDLERILRSVPEIDAW